MNRITTLFLSILFAASIAASTSTRHRVLVSTDIGGTDPDDNQSMIHLLMYANEFDIEGLVSSPSYGEGSRDEILRMIDEYEMDYVKLQRGLASTGNDSRFPTPAYLRSISKQGRRTAASLRGYDTPTEGSDWIVRCARGRRDSRPLWVLVWGALEDVAQALHDAPDIANHIRVYWIGGPNKKWGCNAYNYIVSNFPDLWFIENNASYRGFIGSAKDPSPLQGGYWHTFMNGAGMMGNDFRNYYDGIAKMGDTPSLLYLMSGDPEDQTAEHWGGRFESFDISPKYIVRGPMSAADTIPVYSLMEWRLRGPEIDIPADSACFVMTVDRQKWLGYHEGDGVYVVRYAPKAPATLSYTITSDVPGFPVHEGVFTVANEWPAVGRYAVTNHAIEFVPIMVNPERWFTDCGDTSLMEGESDYEDYRDVNGKWQGAATISRWRNDVMIDWAKRFDWLR